MQVKKGQKIGKALVDNPSSILIKEAISGGEDEDDGEDQVIIEFVY